MGWYMWTKFFLNHFKGTGSVNDPAECSQRMWFLDTGQNFQRIFSKPKASIFRNCTKNKKNYILKKSWYFQVTSFFNVSTFCPKFANLETNNDFWDCVSGLRIILRRWPVPPLLFLKKNYSNLVKGRTKSQTWSIITSNCIWKLSAHCQTHRFTCWQEIQSFVFNKTK